MNEVAAYVLATLRAGKEAEHASGVKAWREVTRQGKTLYCVFTGRETVPFESAINAAQYAADLARGKQSAP